MCAASGSVKLRDASVFSHIDLVSGSTLLKAWLCAIIQKLCVFAVPVYKRVEPQHAYQVEREVDADMKCLRFRMFRNRTKDLIERFISPTSISRRVSHQPYPEGRGEIPEIGAGVLRASHR